MKALVLASCLVIGSAGVSWSQTPAGSPPIGHGPPNSIAAPAMSLKDLKPQPAEALGLVPKLTLSDSSGHAIHILPTPAVAAQRAKYGLGVPPAPGGGSPTAGALIYHAGGSVMPYQLVYLIFWAPAHLQNGGATGFSPLYGTINYLHPAWIPSNSLLNIATQYYQTIGGVTSYVVNAGYLAGVYVTSDALPASGCTDTANARQLHHRTLKSRAEDRTHVDGHKWLDRGHEQDLQFCGTSSGEGSCFDSGSSSCAYTQYCAYHGHFSSGGQNVIYANEPYASADQLPGRRANVAQRGCGRLRDDFHVARDARVRHRSAAQRLVRCLWQRNRRFVQLQFWPEQLDQSSQQHPCQSVQQWLVLGGPNGV